MDLNNIFQSKIFQRVIIGLGIVIVIAMVFKVGMFVGSGRADFAFRWGENYHRNFGGPRGGFMGEFGDRNFIDAHGTFGRIIKIELPNITIGGEKDVEKVVVLKNDTVVKAFNETVLPKDLKVDDNVVVIGSPNDAGQIEAKLLRVMPPPPPFGGPGMGFKPTLPLSK
ncbi:MAG: hypothetical protein WCT53_05980 [Candidatus Gracilibacteria bacterium]|jgi:hypothetical protein